MNYTYAQRKDVYAELWQTMNIRPERYDIIARQADRIMGFMERYLTIEKATGVPWYVIGLMHLRESNLNFGTHLHNGDSLARRTVRVPAGHPAEGSPPFTFEESAIDALKIKGLDKIKDWSIERVAYTLEAFNGFGYIQFKVNSPYLWAGTNQYTKGKYIRDHVFSNSHIDQQLGTMAVIKVILDKQIPSVETKPKTPTEIAVNAPKAEAGRPSTGELVKVSRKAWYTRLVQWLGFGGGGATVLGKAADMANLGAAKTTLDGVKSIWTEYGPEIAFIVCTAIVCFTVLLIKLQKDDIVEGRSTPSGAAE